MASSPPPPPTPPPSSHHWIELIPNFYFEFAFSFNGLKSEKQEFFVFFLGKRKINLNTWSLVESIRERTRHGAKPEATIQTTQATSALTGNQLSWQKKPGDFCLKLNVTQSQESLIFGNVPGTWDVAMSTNCMCPTCLHGPSRESRMTAWERINQNGGQGSRCCSSGS